MPITIGELTTVPAAGDPITSPWAQTISNQYVLHQFTSVADRDAKWTSPPNGAFCVTADTGTFWERFGGSWIGLIRPLHSVKSGITGLLNPDANGYVTFGFPNAFPAGTTPAVVVMNAAIDATGVIVIGLSGAPTANGFVVRCLTTAGASYTTPAKLQLGWFAQSNLAPMI